MFFIRCNICALLFIISVYSHATCTLQNGAREGSITVSMDPQNLNPGQSLAIKTSQTQAQAASAMGIARDTKFVRCTNSESLVMTNGSFTPIAGSSPDGTGFIETGIDNLYFYIQYTPGTATGVRYPGTDGGIYSRLVSTFNGGYPRWLDIGNLNVHLYQNGKISNGGVVPAGTIVRWETSDGVPFLNINVNSFTVYVKACSVLNPTLNVDMGAINKSQFSGVGSTAGGNNFTISMNCDSDIDPAITFTGVTPKNGSVLSLNDYDSNTTAQGVGIIMLYQNKQINFDSPLNLGASLQGVNNFNFDAKYIQTSEKITGGSANSTVNFTVTYQ